jgi:thioredoxin-like negative regulator of GroEL
LSGFGQDYREEIKSAVELVKEGREADALDILDNLNWRKIHNISAIVQASQLYESLGKIEDAKDLLMMAHD